VDERERVRATRVEVARLIALPYREKLTANEQEIRDDLLAKHIATLPLADREAFQAYLLKTDDPMDWSVLEEPWAAQAIEMAVNQTLSRWGDTKLSATEDDLTQSARIILAERAAVMRKARKPHVLLARDLGHLLRYEHRDESLDELEEANA
jgi:hypothetical protein